MSTITHTTHPTPPEGFHIYSTTYQDGWQWDQRRQHLNALYVTRYLFGRTHPHFREPGKIHGAFMRDDGNGMRTWCGRDLGWFHDNWCDVLPTLYPPEDFCMACWRALNKETS